MDISLVIPCFNEAKNLPLVFEKCACFGQVEGCEVILVDNGSFDDTQEVLSAFLPLFPHCRSVHVAKNQGYGFGILSGLKAAEGDILAWTHADMQTDPQDVLEGLKFFKAGGDLFVKGKRYGRPFSDAFFSAGMSIFETVLMGKLMWDINAQPTIFRKAFFEEWQNPPHDFSLDLYAYYMARQTAVPIKRFPVRFGERVNGSSHWNVNWSAKWKFIKRTVGYSLKLKSEINKLAKRSG